jgi:hypothetical protein
MAVGGLRQTLVRISQYWRGLSIHRQAQLGCITTRLPAHSNNFTGRLKSIPSVDDDTATVAHRSVDEKDAQNG